MFGTCTNNINEVLNGYHPNENENLYADSEEHEEANLRQNINPQQHDASPNMQNIEACDLQKSLCPRTRTTIGEALLLCMTLVLRHSFTWVAVVDTLKMMNMLFDRNVVSHTKYKIRRYFPFDTDKVQYHVICPQCSKYLGKRKTVNECYECECGKICTSLQMTSYFLEFDIKSQLQTLFVDPNIVNSLHHRFDREKLNKEALENIYDGKQYEKYVKLNLLRDEYNFSYIFNTDGCQTSNSSKVSMWPIYIMINELPLKIRSRNIITAGLWVHKFVPNMQVFLQPFVDQANELAITGFVWKFNNKEIRSKIFPLLCCVDSVARCAILNMKQYNRHFGCTFCEHPTLNVDGIRKYPISTTIPKIELMLQLKEI